ncbi:divergent PAP2 family protein [Clostridium sp. Marseille-P299]|uniref:divergent PAP2 family protein n=1 Tax=Clostridium sp. Marseille-P299 TaxID=1805477 RepID=UPI0008325955|nr:divergent PAP2 family protein [Clostridium sp. Marseille-P299]
MELLEGLINNKIFMSAVMGWLTAQVLKVIIYAIINREFKLERFVGSGGMPSSHSATVCALVTATILQYGTSSFEFAIAGVFAIIVMYDARGVRLETGKQAEAINQLFELLTDQKVEPVVKLKELVGHTPLQVLVGGILGVIVALLM